MSAKKTIKSKKTPENVGAYDVELMTENELRQYVEALKVEHVRLRKTRNFCLEDKKELLGIMTTVKDDIMERKNRTILKNMETQQLMVEADPMLQFEEEFQRIIELEQTNESEENALKSFLTLKMAEIRNREEEDALMKQITEKERDYQDLQYTFKRASIQLNEGFSTEHLESYKKIKYCIDEHFVREYKGNFLKMLDLFSESNIEELKVILGDKPSSGTNLFADSIAKMTAFFKDIYWKNLKTSEEFHRTLTGLKDELKSVTTRLSEVTNENRALKECLDRPVEYSVTSTSSTIPSVKKEVLEELTYEKYQLELKLAILNKEFSDIKEKFVSAVRKIYQKANLKTLLSEEWI